MTFLAFTVSHTVFSQEIPRKILAFYDLQSTPDLTEEELKEEMKEGKAINPDYAYLNVHQRGEMPLNYLGLEVVYHNITDPLPTDQEMVGFRGIFTWFKRLNAVADPAPYCTWLTHQITTGKKVVIFGEPGVFANKKRRMSPQCKQFFKTLGAEYLGGYSDVPFFWKLVSKDPKWVEFERKIEFVEGLQYSQYRALSKQSKVFLKIRRADLEESTSDLVFITPHGGFVHESFAFYFNPDTGKKAWRINPFLFFQEAFGMKGLPRPDITTLNGRRIFYNQIDGDGFFNVSYIDNESFSAEVLYREILKKYPDFPITASIITGYLDLPEFKSERTAQLYRNVFGLPNIEPASHGYAHPLSWAQKTVAIKVPRYKFSAVKEIQNSVQLLQQLLEKNHINKKVNLFLWTGDAVPNKEEIGLTYQIGILNINGGLGLVDDTHDGYAYLFPIGILRGPFRQIYASDPDEYLYTNYWEGPYYGYSRLIDTFKKTESPMRVKPMDVYYHYYVAERQAGLKALNDIYAYVASQEVFPLFTTEYARLANDFFKVKMFPLSGGFRISDNETLKTIRFDEEPRNVDLERSKGVLGFRFYQGSLYVFMDDAKTHDVYFTNAKPAKPYVVSASFYVGAFKGSLEHLSFSKKGWLKSEIVFGGMIPSKKYRIQVGEEKMDLLSDGAGLLKINFKSGENNGPSRLVKIEAI